MELKSLDKLSVNKRVDVINNIIAETFLDFSITDVDDSEYVLDEWIENNDVLPIPYFPREKDFETNESQVFIKWNTKNEAFRKLLGAIFASFGVFSDINEPLLICYYDQKSNNELRYGIWFRQHEMRTETKGNPETCEVEMVSFVYPEKEEVEQYIKDDGNSYVILEKDGVKSEHKVCDLVWNSFNGEIPEGFEVIHIDGDKQNNKLENLKLEKINAD